MIQSILALGRITIKDAVEKKIIYLFIFFTVVIFLVSEIFTAITPGAEIAFLTDIGLSLISFLEALAILFLAGDFIPDEIEKRTLYTVLAYPVRRFEFILGKFLGISGILLLLHFLMSLVLVAVLSLFRASLKPDLFLALALIYGPLLIFTSIIIMGSTFLSRLVNIIFSLFFYLLGHLVSYLRHLAERLDSVPSKFTLTFFSRLVPDLERFEVKDKLIVDMKLPPGIVSHAFSYAFLYIIVVMMLAYVFFNEKEV